MNRDVYKVTLHIDSYIAAPFWPEKSDVINIKKMSGESRQKSEDKRALAIIGHLTKIGMTEEQYVDLQKKADRQWYRKNPDDDSSPIVLPRHHLAGCLVQTVGTSPKSIRGPYEKDSFRHHVQLSDFVTEKTAKDRLYDRYVKMDTSNQRSRCISEVIEDFEAVGTISLEAGTKIEPLMHLLEFSLSNTGLGSARKMGYGRGTLVTMNLMK
jgi:hypothetical protein